MKGDDAVAAALRELLSVQSTAAAGHAEGSTIGLPIRARGTDFVVAR